VEKLINYYLINQYLKIVI